MAAKELGRTGIWVSPIGLRTALGGGITWFDTAEMDGGGNAERSISTGLT